MTNSEGFAAGKNLEVTVEYSSFTAENVSTTIPFVLKPFCNYFNISTQKTARAYMDFSTGSKLTFNGQNDGSAMEKAINNNAGSLVSDPYIQGIELSVDSSDWGKALAGEYSATITFTAEVVVTE